MTEGMRKAADASRESATAAREAMGDRIDAAKEATSQRVEATGERVEAAKAATGEKVEAAKVAAGEKVDAAKAAAVELQQKVKPKLRGVIHEYSFPVSLVAGGLLVYFAAGGRARLALAIYAISLSALLGTSALYHRVNWKRPSSRMWMRRLDHSMIFLLIAGTVTPFLLLVVGGTLGTALLVAVWAGALAGIFVEFIWVNSPRWVSVAVYLTVGWIGAIAFPSIVANAGVVAGALIAIGGILYTIGAVVYARQRPDPRPATSATTRSSTCSSSRRRSLTSRRSPSTPVRPADRTRCDRRGRSRAASFEVGPIARGEMRATARALARAFLDDPISTAVGPRRRGHRRIAGPLSFMGILIASRRHGGTIRVARDPGGTVLGVEHQLRAGRLADPRGRRRLRARLAAARRAAAGPPRPRFDRTDPRRPRRPPALYLWFLAVDPAAQSRGVGRALLAELHAESAELEVPTYLETGKMENVAYYALRRLRGGRGPEAGERRADVADGAETAGARQGVGVERSAGDPAGRGHLLQ